MNTKRAIQLMDKAGLEALIAITPPNVTYLTGFSGLSHWVLRRMQTYAVFCNFKNVSTYLLAPAGDLDSILSDTVSVTRVVSHGIFHYSVNPAFPLSEDELSLKKLVLKGASYPDVFEALKDLLEEVGLSRARLGVEEDGMTPADYAKLKLTLPGVKIINASQLFRKLRMVKTENEALLLEKAAQLTRNAIMEASHHLKRGVTEKEIAFIFENAIIRGGGRPKVTVISFGERSAFPNALPTHRSLKSGDLIRFDVGCCYHNYCSDVARTFVLGRTTKDQEKNYYAVLAGERAAIEHVRPGEKSSNLFSIAVNSVMKNGLSRFQRHHCGHGIGIEFYDPPSISLEDDSILEEGMVINIETPHYELGYGGFHVEDTILVTKNGYRSLSGFPPKGLTISEG